MVLFLKQTNKKLTKKQIIKWACGPGPKFDPELRSFTVWNFCAGCHLITPQKIPVKRLAMFSWINV